MPRDDTKALFDAAQTHLQKVGKRVREKTITDGLLHPPVRSAPGAPGSGAVPRPRTPLPAAELGSDPVAARSASEPPSDGFTEREAPTKALPGHRRARPRPDSFYPNYGAELSGVTPSVIAQAERVPLGRLLVLIVATSTGVGGVVAALGASVVNIITAMRPPSNTAIMERLDAIETRVNGDFGLPLETKARQAAEEKLSERLDKLEAKQKTLEGVAVPITVQPKSRRGKSAP